MTDRSYYKDGEGFNGTYSIFAMQSLAKDHMTDDLYDDVVNVLANYHQAQQIASSLNDKLSEGTSLDVSQDIDSCLVRDLNNCIDNHLGTLSEISVKPWIINGKKNLKVELLYTMNDGSIYQKGKEKEEEIEKCEQSDN